MALPPTSPRLPSPPPAAEIQIGPKSPAIPGATLAQQQMEQQMEQTILDANAKRRIHPGTRAADFAAGPPLVPLNELDSAFQLQEHLSALHYFHTAGNTQALTRDTAQILALAPTGTDRTLWLYELCRFLIAQCNSLIIGFLFDTPPCSAATCPEMRASEWQFLCAVHEQPRSCCAIDYCCHTLDWAANVVTNPKIFPSRFAFADQHDKNAANKNLVNVFRRLHRIFAHAWFQHRGVFWSVEGQTGLYVFFKTVCDMYDLLPAENYKLPPEAEGLDTAALSAAAAAAAAVAASVAGSGGDNNNNSAASASAAPSSTAVSHSHSDSAEKTPGLISLAAITDRKSLGLGAGQRSGPAADLLSSEHSVGRTNTRRHIRSSPSVGSSVTTVLEQDEDSSGSPSFMPKRPISILQHAERLSTTSLLSRGAGGQPAAPPTPIEEAEEDKPEELKEPAADAKAGDGVAAAAQDKEDKNKEEDKEDKEATAATGEAAKEEAPQQEETPVAEAEAEAEAEETVVAETPVAEAADAEATESSAATTDAAATDATSEETVESDTAAVPEKAAADSEVATKTEEAGIENAKPPADEEETPSTASTSEPADEA